MQRPAPVPGLDLIRAAAGRSTGAVTVDQYPGSDVRLIAVDALQTFINEIDRRELALADRLGSSVNR
jgi:hypothetical protein